MKGRNAVNKEIERIANRHVARCLGKIEEVHELPALCADVLRREMHYCAKDVATALSDDETLSEDPSETRFNR